MVITSSTGGLKSPLRVLDVLTPGAIGYVAGKHAVVGIMRTYANALGPYSIRCNTVHPTGVNTPMVANEPFATLAATQPSLMEGMHNALPVPLIEAVDVSNAIVYLCSEAGRYITGVTMPVDAGAAAY